MSQREAKVSCIENGNGWPDDHSLNIHILRGREGFRLRVGQYRFIYTRQEDYLTIEVVKIRLRGDVYRG